MTPPSLYRSDEQARYADVVSKYLALPPPQPPLLLHGAAGLGKTRAFMAPALQHSAASGRRLLVATATVQLVSQLAESADLQVALAAAGRGVRVERYISQRQFVSPSRAQRHGLTAEIGESTDEVLERYGSNLKPEDICIDVNCPLAEREPYRAQKAACQAADVVITTHATVILDRRTGGKVLDLDSFGTVILDEADRLPAAASLQLDALITQGEMASLGIFDGQSLSETLVKLLSAAEERLKVTKSDDERDTLHRVRANAADALAALLKPEPWRVVGRLDDGSIAMRVKNPARILKGLTSQAPTAFTSGTLAVGGRFDNFKHAIGLSAASPLSAIIEPAKHGLLRFILAKREVQLDTVEWLEYVAAGVKVAREGGGNVLVLTTSFETSKALGQRVDGAVVQQRGESLTKTLKRFAGGVLVSPAAWEGVDLGHQWTDVVIPRVPYPNPDNVLATHFLTSQDQAIRRLTQGMARGLRQINAACTVWILDPRFPLPASLVNANVATQQQATKHSRLAAAVPDRFRAELVTGIPLRFRQGLHNTYRQAEIFSGA